MSIDKIRMNHASAIKKYIEAIIDADDMHALIIEGDAGWGKTTAVEEALKLSKIETFNLGLIQRHLIFITFWQSILMALFYLMIALEFSTTQVLWQF